MGQHAWVLEVRPGYEEEYKKRHDEVWPEMLERGHPYMARASPPATFDGRQAASRQDLEDGPA